MCEDYTRQPLPEKKYRELLGTALYVFNSNNAFIIENIIRVGEEDSGEKIEGLWYQLIDMMSGGIFSDDRKGKNVAVSSIAKKFMDMNPEIVSLFTELIDMRNRIIHSFAITNTNDGNKQYLSTKTRIQDGNNQFIITEEYLINFIRMNDKLCLMLCDARGY